MRSLRATLDVVLFALAYLLIAVVLVSTRASAADTVPSVTMVSIAPLWTSVEPYILSSIAGLLTAVLGFGCELLRRWTGIAIDARQREALHSAAMTGVQSALHHLDLPMSAMTYDVRSAAIAHAVTWIEESVPAAIRHFGVTPDQLEALAAAKLGQLIGAAPLPPSAPPASALATVEQQPGPASHPLAFAGG